MQTSGSVDFNQTANDICNAALRKLAILGEGEEPTGQMILDTRSGLNRLIKKWQADGLHIFKEDEIVVFPANTLQPYYTISSTGDYTTLSTELVQTYVTIASFIGNTTINVNNAAGIQDGFYIGIVQNNNTIHWSLVNGAPAGTIVTIADALTADVTINNPVYVFEKKVNKPLRILDGRIQTGRNSEMQMTALSREDYFILPSKQISGLPMQYFYDSRSYFGRMYTWPIGNNPLYLMRFTVEQSIEDFDAGSDYPDMPQEWLNPLVWNLAVEMAPEFGVGGEKYQIIATTAQKFYQDILGWDRENTPVQFQPRLYY